MPALLTTRQIFALITLIVTGLLGFALYSEQVLGLEPCPLCVTQRLFFMLAGVIALAAWIQGPGRIGRRLYALGIGVSVLAGAAVATRQIWLQQLPPDQVPACGPDLSYMLDVFPLSETLRVMLSGDGNCAEVHWQFLGLSMPAWALVWFLLLFGLTVLAGWRRHA